MAYEIHNLLRASLYNGEKDKWNELCYSKNVDVWKNDILLKMIQEKSNKSNNNNHLLLLKQILEDNIFPPKSYIEYKKNILWITTLTENNYPWYVCNS